MLVNYVLSDTFVVPKTLWLVPRSFILLHLPRLPLKGNVGLLEYNNTWMDLYLAKLFANYTKLAKCRFIISHNT